MAAPNDAAQKMTLRFKYGPHTIFLFVDPIATRGAAAAQLLRVLRLRYPDGLTTSTDPDAPVTPLPGDSDSSNSTTTASSTTSADNESRIEFAVPSNPADPDAGGWTLIDAQPDEVLVKKARLADGACVAFRFVGTDGDESGYGPGDGWVVQSSRRELLPEDF